MAVILHCRTHGDAHAAQLDTVLSAQAAFFFVPAQFIIMLEDVPQAAQTGYCLAEHGGERRTEHAHLEDDDTEQIQPDVQKACHQQEVQGRLLSPRARIRALVMLYSSVNGMPIKMVRM